MPKDDAGDDLPIPAPFGDVVAYHLRVAQEASFQAISQAAAPSELKPGWYTLLTLLSDHPGLTPSELSRLCGRDRSTLTATLKALNARGLIERERNKADERSYHVRLTRQGRAMQRTLRRIAEAHDARLDAIVGPDKSAFIQILHRIAARIGRGMDAAND